jgi:hypothetical protein
MLNGVKHLSSTPETPLPTLNPTATFVVEQAPPQAASWLPFGLLGGGVLAVAIWLLRKEWTT